jgi:hypothetical protein
VLPAPEACDKLPAARLLSPSAIAPAPNAEALSPLACVLTKKPRPGIRSAGPPTATLLVPDAVLWVPMAVE